MLLVAERAFPTYVAALEQSLDQAVDRLPVGRLRTALIRLRHRLGHDQGHFRFGALHRLAAIAETQGWLSPEEAIVIEKLAHRVAFYAGRTERPAERRDELREAGDESAGPHGRP